MPSLFGDHLGSSSLAMSITNGGATVTETSELRYRDFGEQRYSSGATFATDRRYTGQIQESQIGMKRRLVSCGAKREVPSFNKIQNLTKWSRW